MNTEDRIRAWFFEKFNENPVFTIKAPGRINLLGEHTDYNGGFVLPAAIDKAIYFQLSSRSDLKLIVEAVDLEESVEFDNINEPEIKLSSWSLHLVGVILEIKKLGFTFSHGLNVTFGGDIPNGAGLSSSAAVESGFGFALNEVFNLKLSKLQIAEIAQLTEHNFVGVKCGVMDMYASVFSKENSVIKLDCKTLSHEYLPIQEGDYQFVLVNSAVKHNLAESAYNERRQQCESGVITLNEKFGDIAFLRDANLDQLNEIKADISEVLYNRCKYVIEENNRVEAAVAILNNNDLEKFGNLMNQTHEGLSNLYEVSCSELDFLQKTALNIEGVIGSRMMGGGFGGCTLNLIKKVNLDNFVGVIKAAYEENFKIIPEVYIVKIGRGVSKI